MEETKEKLSPIYLIIALTIAASFSYALSSGIRNNYGIMLNGIIQNSGISFVSVSFVFAVGQLVFGLVQPAFGIMAAKKGTFPTLVAGVILMAVGMMLIPFSKSVLSLVLCLGVLLPAGTGAISFGIIMGVITPKLPVKTAATVSGIVNASSGIGNTLMSPLMNSLITNSGLLQCMLVFVGPVLLIIPMAWFMSRKPKTAHTDKATTKSPKEQLSVVAMFSEAFRSRTYIFLMIGFFTCGFHMAIITNHLPTEFVSYGFTSEAAAYAFSVYGLATIIGSVLSGNLCGRIKMKNVLGTFYGIRPFTVLIFLFVPKTMFAICAYAAVLGFSGAATVPPVSGIVGKIWGNTRMATLFGFVFLVHQIGGFCSAWLGGICFDVTGSYTTIWVVDIVFCAIAAIVSFMIKEQPEQSSNPSMA